MTTEPEFQFRLHEDCRHVEVKCPHMYRFVTLPLGDPEGWTVVSTDPLTVTPSIDGRPDCTCHGFITNGAWVGA